MNRRKVLLGMGTAAVGSGAAFGSGAFTQMTANRSATISVANDTNGYLSIQEGTSGNTAVDGVSKTSSGVLKIDLSQSTVSGDGANLDSVLRIGGNTGDSQGTYLGYDSTNSAFTGGTVAFSIANQTNSSLTVGFANNFSQIAVGNQTVGSVLNLLTTLNDSTPTQTDLAPDSDNTSLGTSMSLQASGSAGDTAAVIIEVDTTSVSDSTSVSSPVDIMSKLSDTLKLRVQ